MIYKWHLVYEIYIAVYLLTGIVTIGFPLVAYGQELSPTTDPIFKKTWQKFTDICDDAVEFVVDETRGKKSALDTITFREPKYVRLLKDAQDVLGVSEATRHFQEIEKLRSVNNGLGNEITELKREKIMAPDSSYNPLVNTKERIEKSIAKKQNTILENENEIGKIKTGLVEIFQEHGISLAENELDYFLISAEGNELLHLMTIADNMKRIQRIIEDELKNEPNNIELAKIYTGMYLVSLDAFTGAHDTVIRHIGAYREKLKGIVVEAQKNYKDAKKLRKQASTSEYPHIDANMNLNQRTIEVAEVYDSLLQRRNANLDKARSALKHKSDIARNTYRTLTNGSSLIALVNEGSNEYAILMDFEMPEFDRIYDAGMLNSFAEISEKIRIEN